MIVLEPLKITIKNYSNDGPISYTVPDFPNEPEKGSHKVTFNNVLYIESSDFKELPENGYRRLTPTQCVGLRHSEFVIKVNHHFLYQSGKQVECLVVTRTFSVGLE